MPNVTHLLPNCMSQALLVLLALLAVTGAGLRRKSLKSMKLFRQVPRGGDLICRFLCRSLWTAILFGFSCWVSPSSPSYFYKKKLKLPHKTSSTTASPSSYSASPWISSHSFGYSRRSLAPNWEFEVESASPQWGNLGLLFPFFLVVFRVFSSGLDVSNLPLRNPQQRNKWFR